MCEAEEVLIWLCDELDQKSKEITAHGNAVYQATPFPEEFEDVLNELEELMDELGLLAREARLRLKETRRQVVA